MYAALWLWGWVKRKSYFLHDCWEHDLGPTLQYLFKVCGMLPVRLFPCIILPGVEHEVLQTIMLMKCRLGRSPPGHKSGTRTSWYNKYMLLSRTVFWGIVHSSKDSQ